MRVHLDLELGGVLNLTQVGADVWSRDKETVPILCGFAIDDAPPQCYTFDQPDVLQDILLDAVRAGAPIHAWNASFEATVWNNLLVPRYGYPKLSIDQFHCTMATAACAGLPMSLDTAAVVVGSPYTKDKNGTALMKRMARPRGFNPDGTPRWWHVESPHRLRCLALYNLSDVEAERAIFKRIPVMSKRERHIWLCDQAMNARGMPVDKALMQALGRITAQEILRLNREIEVLTERTVSSASQTSKLIEWLKSRGYPWETMRKNAFEAFIGSPEFYALPEDARKVIVLRAEAAKTSTAKLQSIDRYAAHDGKARQLVQYGGAVRTLRWAGRGPQIQNFPRPSIKHVDKAIEMILDGLDAEGVRVLFGLPLDVVSSCLRGVFKAPDGWRFVVCDYHAIEAIVLAWLADDQALLDVFRRGEDVYVYTAQGIGSSNRTLGKVLRLACGFGMGPLKFRATAAGHGLDLSLDESDDAVQGFRNSNAKIVVLWTAYDNAARQVIHNPGIGTVRIGPVGFRMALPQGRLRGSLLIEKPSGGILVYRNARVENGIIYDGVNQFTRKWEPIRTYGGKLVENVTQSVARDLLADAMVAFEKTHAATVATVHDEIVALCPERLAYFMLAQLKHIMGHSSPWAAGMPLSAAGYIKTRYSKA